MNPKLFKKRLIALYSCWRKQRRDLWGNADVLVICTDSPGNPTRPISSMFFSWLMGHDFPDTVAVFTTNEIYFICGRKKLLSMVRTLESPAMEAVNARVVVHVKSKDENGLEFMDGIIRGMKVAYDAKADCNNTRPLVVGYISGESPKSKLLWSCFNNLNPKEFRSAHVIGFSRLLNHDQDVRYSGNSTDRKDLELFEESISSYKVSGSHHQDCPQIQMQSLPDTLEQMLASTPERGEEAPREANGKKLQLEIGDGNPPGSLQDKGEKSLHPEEVEGSSWEDGSVSDEEDEWVLVEDGGKEECMGKRNKVNVLKQSMALANYKL
ncbi:hypothetical protein RHGRI_030299 [Rhododendron griersonianum]|uniref:FACT complex subunit n=1 Tax=Rhododendron griersonianum TaxID=479676 RepID=A0AAV6IMD6_9ERIC|nr:hypothetical protein RHGRI_030299 [Rhododendron griersonianum]